MISPFVTHRKKILGNYGAGHFLQSVVLAMYNGRLYKADLSGLTNLDQEHLEVFLKMTASYACYGENDSAFLSLARECVELRE